MNLLRSLYLDFYFKVILTSVTNGLVVWGSCSKSLFDEHAGEVTCMCRKDHFMAWIGTHPAIRSQPKSSVPLLKVYTNIDYLC